MFLSIQRVAIFGSWILNPRCPGRGAEGRNRKGTERRIAEIWSQKQLQQQEGLRPRLSSMKSEKASAMGGEGDDSKSSSVLSCSYHSLVPCLIANLLKVNLYRGHKCVQIAPRNASAHKHGRCWHDAHDAGWLLPHPLNKYRKERERGAMMEEASVPVTPRKPLLRPC